MSGNVTAGPVTLLAVAALLVSAGCERTNSVTTAEERERNGVVRTIPVSFDSSFAEAPADGGPSGAIADMPADWEDDFSVLGPSPYGCIMTWPVSDSLYKPYRYYYFFAADLRAGSGGRRHRLKFVVRSPAAPKRGIMSSGRCWIPASDDARLVTEAVLQSWAKRRNSSGAPLSFGARLF